MDLDRSGNRRGRTALSRPPLSTKIGEQRDRNPRDWDLPETTGTRRSEPLVEHGQ